MKLEMVAVISEGGTTNFPLKLKAQSEGVRILMRGLFACGCWSQTTQRNTINYIFKAELLMVSY